MTASVLLRRYQIEALACQDLNDHQIDNIPVRTFANKRLPFLLANLAASQRASHVFYDFAGTARAHIELPFRRRPYAVWVHGWEVWGATSPKYLRAIAGARLLLANSAYTVARANGALPASVEVIACPLGTIEDHAPDRLGPPDGPPTVMLLGRADELFAKGHDLLISIWPEVVKAVPNATLLLVGGGNALDKVRGLVDASPARESIRITGFVTDDALNACWQRAAVFALLGFAEGFGLVYAEAMRRGLPVVASMEDAGQEINVEGTTGFNISRANRRHLIEVLVTLLQDLDLARRLGAAGHQRWKEQYRFSAFERRFTSAINGFMR